MDEMSKAAHAIDPTVSWEVVRRILWLRDAVRGQGVNILGAKGSGKSRLLSYIVWQDYFQGGAQVILDHLGPTIDGFLTKACEILPQLSEHEQRAWWDRIVYVDVSAEDGAVVALPSFYRLGREDISTIAQRPLSMFLRLDPELEAAPITGANALWRIGTHTNAILAAGGYQLTEAIHLLTHPVAWLSHLAEIEHRVPDIAPSVAFFTDEYIKWSKEKQATLSETLKTKIELLTVNPTLRAIFGANTPGIDWEEVISKRKTVLIDARRILDTERRRLLMLWILHYFLSFVKYRGANYHHLPIGLVIDELSLLTSLKSRGESILVEDLNELINVYGRNNRVRLTTASQELYQFTPTMQKMLLSMGTQIFSSTSDIDAAITLARNIFDADSYFVKHWHPMYMMLDDIEGAIPTSRSRLYIPKTPQIIDYRPEYMRLEEQHYEQAKRIKNQQTFHFFVRPALSEGTNSTSVYKATIKDFDRGLYVNAPLVERARRLLAKRSGIPRDVLLEEIAARIQGIPVAQSVTRTVRHRNDTMTGYEQRTYLPGTPSDRDTDEEPYVDYK